MSDVYVKGPVELRLGSYLDVLGDVEPDALLADPPFGERTHAGNEDIKRFGSNGRRPLSYVCWSPDDVRGFLRRWAPVDGWVVGLTDDDLAPVWRDEARALGRYAFASVPVLQHRPRLGGDGPGSCAIYAMASRPKNARFRGWGSLPGWYTPGVDRDGHIGGKPLGLMRALVRDYSRPVNERGEPSLICDPCAGGATTLIAAALEGRRAIGAEIDPSTFEKACARIERHALTPPLPGLERAPMDGTQEGFDLG